MVERLAARLHQDGSDVDGWLRLVWRRCDARIVCPRTRLLGISKDVTNAGGKLRKEKPAVGRAGKSLHEKCSELPPVGWPQNTLSS